MSVGVEMHSSDALMEDYAHYRALSALAVASCVLGLLSAATFLSWSLAIIPLLGLLTGLAALVRIGRNAGELTGTKLAWVGVALSVIFFCGGASYLTYAYMAELPPGYERLNYAELQPDPDVQGQIYPPQISAKSDQRVFIKGYVYPGKQTSGIKQFVLCRDNGDCCFGGQPRLTDRILVTLSGPLALEYSTRLRHVAGTFRVEPGRATDGLGGVIYHLDADYLK
jgi:hypothetical protein